MDSVMSGDNKRDYDIVVFGASGVTGQYVIEELALETEGIKWCVAGRSTEKLTRVLHDIGILIDKKLDDVKIIEADVSTKESLDQMCKMTKLVINCVGPYRFFGEQVVEASVRNGTHHIDVSGEPEFLESMQLKYFDEAKSKSVYVIGSCGFDSIPCDLGVETVKRNFDGDLNSVETYLKIDRPAGSTINFATWQSAVYGLAHALDLGPIRQEIKKKLFTKEMPKNKFPLERHGKLHKSAVADGWCIPFIGSDCSVIIRTQKYNFQYKNERPAQVSTYMKSYSLLYAVATLVMGGIFVALSKFVYGRYLLEKYPELFSFGVFSKVPPTREMSSGGTFEMIFHAQGWSEKLSEPCDQHKEPPNKEVTAVLKGPDSGYITTAICVVSAALMVLKENGKMPDVGGVYTPGSAFGETTLMKRLEGRGITMTFV